MTYNYKDYVKVTGIQGDNVFRFLLEFDLTGGKAEKSALVIMQNPSKADKEKSDQTINTVLEVMHNSEYSKCYIMNLIPYYATDSSTVAEKARTDDGIYKKNDEYMKTIIASVSKIFVAWGGNGGFDPGFYQSRVYAVKNLLGDRTVYCYKKNKSNKMPIHPARNNWKKGITENDFIIYDFH